MKCPSCSSSLAAVKADDVLLELCSTGCGGIWFDQGELAKFDEPHEPIGQHILRALKDANVVVDHSKQRFCPKCVSHSLSRLYYDSQKDVEVDQCTQCSGFWLDLGELHRLRTQTKASADMQKVYNDYVDAHLKKSSGKELPKSVLAVFRLLF